MRKITVFNRVSADGFFAGPKGEMDWFVHDPEVDKAAHERMKPDTLLLGRVTYQLFESFWPHVLKDPKSPEELRNLAEELNQMTKIVFSKTLKDVSWVNARLAGADIIKEVKGLKQGKGADITIFGSGSIVRQLADKGLIDEYLLVVTPVIMGKGQSMFTDIGKFNLKLLETKAFKSGNVLLHYQKAT